MASESTTTSTAAPASLEAGIHADRIRLVGNLPGSDGTLAFWGDLAVATVWDHYDEPSSDDGFILVDISDPGRPKEVSRFGCIASGMDVSIWEDLVFLSQDEPSAGEDCDAGITSEQAEDAFAGIRVVSIADPKHPVLLAAVPTGVTDRSFLRVVQGSHTHTLMPDLDHLDDEGDPAPRILIYSGDGWAERAPIAGTIVEVPLEDPSAARAIDTIDIGTDSRCHDISFFMPRDLMVCSAYDSVILFDVSDPERPERISTFSNSNVENHHSTTFSNDGRTLVLSDEVFTEVCSGGTEEKTGALWFYDISDLTAPVESSWFQLPRPNVDHYCYAHEANVVPLPTERDIVVAGWFGGGVNLVDFTDPTRPVELAYWVSTEREGEHSFAYSSYW